MLYDSVPPQLYCQRLCQSGYLIGLLDY